MKLVRNSILLVLFMASIIYAQNAEITILHMNDTHGRDSADMVVDKKATPPTTNYKAGAAKRAFYIGSVKKEKPNTLVLHAGDTITGSVYSTVYKGQDEVTIQNMIGFNAIAIGNHLFDYGIPNANGVVSKRKMPTLSVNVKTKNGKYFAKPYIVTNISGINIAIIGVTTSDAVYSGEIRENLIIEDEIKSLKEFLAATPLNTTNNVTILLSHAGVNKDQEIAKAIPNTFNIIVGGHTHTLIEKPLVVGNTAIVQAGYYGDYVGKLDIDVKNGKLSTKDIKYTLIAMDNKIGEDAKVKKYIAEMDKKLAKEFNVKIGSLPRELEHAGIRSNSMTLGNFASDLVLDAYSKADMAFMNSGSLRTPLPEGTITLGKIQNEFFPFDNEVILATFDGATIKEYLSISGKKRGAGAFLQLSRGMEVVYDAKSLDIISIKLNGKNIEDKTDYVVVVSSFVFSGGDGYADKNGNALGKKAKNFVMTGNDMRDAMINDIKKLGDIKESYLDNKPRSIFK